MNLHRIASKILGVDDIALTAKQCDYLQAAIDELPGIEQRALADSIADDYGYTKNLLCSTIALDKLRLNQTLMAILSLSVMSYDSLVNVMIDVITGEAADNDYYVEKQDDDTMPEPDDKEASHSKLPPP